MDLTDSWAVQASAGEMALRSYRLRVESHGLFETLALPALGPAVFDGVDDPIMVSVVLSMVLRISRKESVLRLRLWCRGPLKMVM